MNTLPLPSFSRARRFFADHFARGPVAAFVFTTATGTLLLAAVGFSRVEAQPAPDSQISASTETQVQSPDSNKPTASAPPAIGNGQYIDVMTSKTSLKLSGIVINPNGKPAAGATVSIIHSYPSSMGGVSEYETAADADGFFIISNVRPFYSPSRTCLWAENENGYGYVAINPALTSYVLQLKPWGRIEGQVDMNVLYTPGKLFLIYEGLMGELNAHPLLVPATIMSGQHVSVDPEGKFVVEHAYHGLAKVEVGYVDVKPGETARIDITTGGRTIKGRIKVPAAEAGHKIEMNNGMAVMKQLSKGPEMPEFGNSLQGFAERYRWKNAQLRDPVRRAEMLTFREYRPAVDAEGNFQIEHVPPGTYMLQTVYNIKTTDQGASPSQIGRFSIEGSFVVPPDPNNTEVPLDLGLVETKSTYSAEPQPPA